MRVLLALAALAGGSAPAPARAQDESDWLVSLVELTDRWIVLAESEHFRVQVLRSALNDINRPNYQEHAQKIFMTAERAAKFYFGEMGFKVPDKLQDVFGPNPTRKQIVEITYLGDWIWGAANTPITIAPTFKISHPDLFVRTNKPVEDTTAHELFHLVQRGYDAVEADWIKEATAVAMTDLVLPEMAGAENFSLGLRLKDWYLLNGTPLNHFRGDDNQHAYSAGLFIQNLIERHDRAVVREIWEECGAVEDDNSLQALETVLARRGTNLSEAFTAFATDVLFKRFDPKYKKALDKINVFATLMKFAGTFPPPWPIERGGGAPHLGPAREASLKPLTAHYVRYRQAAPVEPGSLFAAVEGTGAGADAVTRINAAFHLEREAGAWFEGGRHPLTPGAFRVLEHLYRAGDPDFGGALVITNTNRKEEVTARYAFSYHHPPAIVAVTVAKAGEPIYRARRAERRWDRTPPEWRDPVEVKKNEDLQILVETSRAAGKMGVRLNQERLELTRTDPDGKHWGATVPHVRLARELKAKLALRLDFDGAGADGLTLDADPLTEVRLSAEGSALRLAGYEPEPDKNHALLLKLEGEATPFSCDLCGALEKPEKEPWRAARCTGRTWHEEAGGKVRDERKAPEGVRFLKNTGSLSPKYDEEHDLWQFKVQSEFGRDYKVELWAWPLETEAQMLAKAYPSIQGLPMKLLAKGPLGVNLSLAGTRPDEVGTWTGRCRLTQFGPDWIEGHFVCDVEVNVLDRQSKGRDRGKWKLEYCFLAPRKAGSGEETSGALKRRLDDGERRERAELAKKAAETDAGAKARLDAEKAELKKRQEAFKADPKDLGALRSFQEQAAKVEKMDREVRDARRNAQKVADEAVRAHRLEALEAAWRGYFQKAPKEVRP